MKTIAAVSTPKGVGAVSMIRLSGDEAIETANKIFKPKSGKSLMQVGANEAVYGVFHDEAGEFDDGLVTVFRAPRSYTGEDVAELCCHGGALATGRLLRAAISAGADYAAAGEYTKRAFINGKLNLSQAEAVGALIEARSDTYLSISVRQLGGELSKKIDSLIGKLSFLAASVYAYIDYPDEDLTDVSVEEMKERLGEILAEIKKLSGSYRFGKAVSEGVKTSIVGRPNTGKSSVFNLLAGCDRAIVTEIAGTTRDVITETVKLGDILLCLADTAGIRDSGDTVEKIGIERSLESIDSAELVILVLDTSRKMSDEDREVINRIVDSGKSGVTVVLLNKSDLGADFDFEVPFDRVIEFSAKEGKGFDELVETVAEMFGEGKLESLGEIITNARQYGAIEKARRAVESAIKALDSFTQDVAGFDIEEAIAALAETDGKAANEEIVNEIFSHFCVGK